MDYFIIIGFVDALLCEPIVIIHFCVDFKALQSALIEQTKTPNRHNVGKNVGLADRILESIKARSGITMSGIAGKMGVMTRTVERKMKKPREDGRVVRVGGKRYGHWEIN